MVWTYLWQCSSEACLKLNQQIHHSSGYDVFGFFCFIALLGVRVWVFFLKIWVSCHAFAFLPSEQTTIPGKWPYSERNGHGLNPWRLWPWCSRILFHICDDAVALCPCILSLMVWNCLWQCLQIACSKLNQQCHSCMRIWCLLVLWSALLDVEQGIILTKSQHDSKFFCYHQLLKLLKQRLHACPSVIKQKNCCPPHMF